MPGPGIMFPKPRNCSRVFLQVIGPPVQNLMGISGNLNAVEVHRAISSEQNLLQGAKSESVRKMMVRSRQELDASLTLRFFLDRYLSLCKTIEVW